MADKAEIQSNKNEDVMRLLVSDLKRRLDNVAKGGGIKNSIRKVR